MLSRFIVFLLINFAGLALGGFFTNVGTNGGWYDSLNKAPWTPPGWVFGAAWTVIMICFAIYMAYRYNEAANKSSLLILFGLQWLLNFAWNPIFFKFHAVLSGLVVIASLTILVGYLLFNGWSSIKYKTLLIAPYFMWLCIATSLNAYILIKN